MRLGIFLLAVLAGCCAADSFNCLVGNLLVQNGIIISKSVETKSCSGLCSKQTLTNQDGSLVMFACKKENKLTSFLNQNEKPCSSSELETKCFCRGDECNRVDLPENLPAPSNFVANNILCYVGFYANNTGFGAVGDVVTCGQGNVCTSVSGVYQGYDAAAYACMPLALCQNILPDLKTGTQCTNLKGTNIQGCCCYDQDCRSLAPIPNLPTPEPFGKNNVTCYQGIHINGNNIYGGSFSQCQGECGSVRIRTVLNGTNVWGEVFVCDPVDVFNTLNLNNDCRTVDTTNLNGVPTGLLYGCACNTDKCIDPTVVPPVYPIKQLKCAVGFLSNNKWLGAEMACSGRCSRYKFVANGRDVAYYTCSPYDICAGFGLESTEGETYNPPQDEELEAYCCSAKDNCNADSPVIRGAINTTAISTAKYPVLCYGGIWVNGVPITNSAYGLCNGECASVNFMTMFAGETHNATIYTCDPVTMCESAGIANGCGPVMGVTACCCDNDLCLDPNRGAPQPNLRCYSGISIPQDGYNQGGDQICDGWCASLNSVINNKNATVYYCSPVGMCRYFGLGFGGSAGNCASIPGADPPVTGCCCSDSDNCLVPDNVNVTAIPARRDPKIVCYEGLHLNGENVTFPYYRICDGECASVMLTGTIGGSNHYAQLFTCDAASSCAAMGLRNNCSTIDNSLSACCCDSDECIDPTVNRYPGTPLKCYVGISTKFSNFTTGADVICDGYCASVAAVVGIDFVTAFHCAPKDLCRSLGLDNSNNTIYLDRYVNAMCCDSSDYCNLAGTNIDPTKIPVSPKEAPKACYSGVFVGTTQVSDGGWLACQGDCVSVSLNTTYNGAVSVASLYTCDPSTVCRNLKAMNRCHKIEDGFEACCCDSDACLDPTVNPPRKPFGDGNLCYVGAYSYDAAGNTILNVGGEEYCEGTCASVTSSLAGANFTAYACTPNYVCSYLGLYDDCQSVYADRTINACCCTSGPNCNLNQVVPQPPPLPQPRRQKREFPITCPAGVIINGNPVTPIEFQVCDGDCASVTINGTVGSAQHIATLYSCDPSTVCNQLSLYNDCATVEKGVTGCCCNTDACLDPLRGKTVPTPPLKCYVGFYSNKINTGAEILCDGKCASVNARLNDDNATLFACVPHKLCRSLELYDECRSMAPWYPEFKACCCDNLDNCNVKMSHLNGKINTTIPLSPLNDFPISCYSGLFINGSAYSDNGWQICDGDCVSVSFTSTFNGALGVASLYTCDPSRVCRNLGLKNNCSTLENGVSGCCCDSAGCIDPTKYPPKTPGNPLYCYAGIQSDYLVNGKPLSVGAEILCDGKCSSLSGIVNGNMVHSYHCVPSSVCRALELYDDCKRVHEDRQIDACCCDNVNNCNIANTTIVPPVPQKTVDFAIACYSGLYVDGIPATPLTLGSCEGQCASISINTTYNKNTKVATLYGCDPTSVCDTLGMKNSCASPEDGITGCCCNTDLCLDPPKNKTVPSGYRKCYNGIYFKGNATGAEMGCTGKCGSVSSTVNGDSVTIFSCVPTTFCRQLELYDECNTVKQDRDITGCCCDNYDNCNVDLAGLNGKIDTSGDIYNSRDYPIACYQGLFVGKQAIASAGWQACQGECASGSITTTINGHPTTATLYTCDAVSTCWQMGMSNNCTNLEQGLSACCCSTDACLDPTVYPPRTPTNPLKCYVGLQSTYQGGLSIGAETYCNGQCASITGIVGGENVTTYHCVADSVCKSLEIKDTCRVLWGDRSLTACCCNNADNCNLKDPNVKPGPPVLPDFPTACYSGLVVDKKPYSALSLGGCYGHCASISLATTYQGANHTATLYTCDPTQVCQQLNLTNSCQNVEPGVSACCCDTDGCINPYTNTFPGPLNCYVGLYTSDGKINTGGSVPCDGYCGSLETTVGTTLYKSYHCVPKSICTQFGLFNERRTISTDKDITGYCCTNGNNCNVLENAVNVTVAPAPTGNPIACRSSIYLNGAPATGDTFTACYGQCASVTYATALNGANNTLTLYTCDPTSVCDSLKLSDSCATLDGGVSGCCCNTDNCVGPNIQPTPPTGYATTTSFSILSFLAAVYIAINQF
ncbi:unnamed protein product [Caenorhabditis bovis]|uniref:Uncharacterized protein n=1 Tax=Caenorhabditis bovis TaxID=2654633 RepID=A0A8S1E8N1_9PELO|nr:unnamed protein product [Caenorhabditis bovis]